MSTESEGARKKEIRDRANVYTYIDVIYVYTERCIDIVSLCCVWLYGNQKVPTESQLRFCLHSIMSPITNLLWSPPGPVIVRNFRVTAVQEKLVWNKTEWLRQEFILGKFQNVPTLEERLIWPIFPSPDHHSVQTSDIPFTNSSISSSFLSASESCFGSSSGLMSVS